MTTLADLTATIRQLDARIAPGSESALWGAYVDRIRTVMGVMPWSDGAAALKVPDREEEWWLGAYACATGESRPQPGTWPNSDWRDGWDWWETERDCET